MKLINMNMTAGYFELYGLKRNNWFELPILFKHFNEILYSKKTLFRQKINEQLIKKSDVVRQDT